MAPISVVKVAWNARWVVRARPCKEGCMNHAQTLLAKTSAHICNAVDEREWGRDRDIPRNLQFDTRHALPTPESGPLPQFYISNLNNYFYHYHSECNDWFVISYHIR